MTKLRARECRPFFDAVVEKADQMGVAVSIAVVGPEGNLIALERMDDAGFITPETAVAKAYTVAAFRAMSPRFPDGLVIQASGGSAPIFRGNEMVGAYAVSGATSDQDEVMGEYARLKVGWAKTKAQDDTPDDVKAHINALYEKAGIKERKL
jgi:glc operon protein GlcG